MKLWSIIFSLFLALPVAFATSEEKMMEEDTVELNQDGEAVADEEIQLEEDAEYETVDGKEVEVDRDVLGDDEIEIDD